jgi:mevalonate kinase
MPANKEYRYVKFRILTTLAQLGVSSQSDVFTAQYEGVVRYTTDEEAVDKVMEMHKTLLSSRNIIEIEYIVAFAYHTLAWDGEEFKPGEATYEPKR